MKFILGKKKEMTQIFTDKGEVFAGTVVTVEPMAVTQVKDAKKDGYDAIQVGSFVTKKKLSKPQAGHVKDMGNFTILKEARGDIKASVGDKIDLSQFAVGDVVEVSGITKGKGFQGVVKRHNFRGGPRTHGNAHGERSPGSISGGLRSHVPKGMRMAGRMGGDRVTVKNLSILAVMPEENKLIISGAVPGRPGTLLEIRAK